MFVPATNPKIEELTKSYRDRRINLSDLESVKIDGAKCCKWCMAKLSGKKYAWCSEDCSTMAWVWANPQKEGGLHVLLARQDFKCNTCQFDYMPYVQDSLGYLNRYHQTVDPAKIREKISPTLMKILKYKAPSNRLPEVDHIVPIYKGGTPLGLSNHQAICFSCHKAKTKIDLSGKRKKG